MTSLFIKNMVCNRCIWVVQNQLEKVGITAQKVSLGEVVLENDLEDTQLQQLKKVLTPLGFEIIDDKKSKIIEKIKTLIIDLVHHQDNQLPINLSQLLSENLHQDYSHLTQLFSAVEGTTIEKYYILQKIEKVKELLVYDELSLSEIADRLHYSSVGYLSNQFKKVTGLTPTHFKKIGSQKRKPLDQVQKTSKKSV